MKLTDYGILFASLFVCMILGLDLSIIDLEHRQVQKIIYNRQMDNVVKDSMLDVASFERDDGSLKVDEVMLYHNFKELLRMQFDITTEESAYILYHRIPLRNFYDASTSMSVDQTEKLRDEMEALIKENQVNQRMETFYQLSFPTVEIENEDWYQGIKGPSFFTLLEPYEMGAPYRELPSAVFSGARLEKKMQE